MKALTSKEIETIGTNRYLYNGKQIWIALTILAACIGVALLIMRIPIADKPWTLVKVLEIASVLLLLTGGFGYFAKVTLFDAPKAGKKFRAEWEKERLTEAYKEYAKEKQL